MILQEQWKEVRIFNFRSWPFTESTPEDTASLLQLISDIENDTNDNKPFVVQCV